MKTDLLPESWQNALQSHLQSESFTGLCQFVEREREQHHVFPPSEDVFNAFRLTPLSQVRVLILGQDPYHDDGQAHGLSFSVQRGIPIPPSLRNIFKELSADLDVPAPSHGCLEAWARQGVLLLNAVLTVRAHEANSHKRQGWEQFTDRVIEVVNELPSVVFVLWGNPAQQKQRLIASRHPVITAVHPSPLSAHRGFFGSRPFSQINSFLQQNQQEAIDWSLYGS